ncbi:glycosyl hydrolase-related protein [Clostridium thermarum]|uniref:glycoside hydrolase family 38 N-terminal domain-containing protein n=1 Tax=Clostridium thermarum TaxID=1716543 RepID=UPI001120E4E6|nr:glycosyl hydrolase-related protein [Clostridium thermarum]
MDKVIVAASTHWDREWYRTFNDFRIRLCDLINNLLELLEEDEDFLCYTFDGQSVVIEDYLEIFPQNKDRIKNLVSKGKLTFGPLYNLPDEFLSSGEAMIRNFLVGHKVCMDIGGKMQAGYIPDNFGHISQMPQILNGVGMKSAFFFRGCSIDTLENKEFIWKAPDGSKVLGEYMLLGYWSLKSWGKLGQSVEDHFKSAYESLKAKSKLNTFLLINGSDHLYQDSDFTAKLKQVKEAFKDLDIVNGSIEDYAKLALERAQEVELKEIEGELRDFRYGPDPNAVGSTRHYLKYAMFEALREVERYAEPLNTIAFSHGEAYPAELFTYAWKHILKALGHDAIAGCSSDEVIKDIHSYIVNAHTIVSRLSDLAFEKLAKKINTEDLVGKEQYLTVFNPLQFDNTMITEAVIHVENQNEVCDIELYDTERNPINYEYIDQWEDIITREFKYESKEKIYRKCFKIRFEAKRVPALGFKNYIVVPKSAMEKRQAELYIRSQGSHRFIENEFYKITPDQNGSLTILDKVSGKQYKDMNTYVSRGDIGDEYQHVSPLGEEHVFATLKSVSVIRNSDLASTLKLKAVLNVPKSADEKFLGRGTEYVDCAIETYVTLYRGCPRIDFKVEIENKASDHVITVKFPTNYINPIDYSHVCFDEIERDNHRFDFDKDLRSTQSFLKPMQNYAGIRGDDGVLNVISKGIYEYNTKPSDEGLDLYITLLRSTSHMFRYLPISWQSGQHSTTPIIKTEDSKELGKCTFYYSLYFGKESINEVSQQYLYPLRCFDVWKTTGKLEEGLKYKSLVNIDNSNVLLSTVKKHEYSDSIVVRLYNTQKEASLVNLDLGFTCTKAYFTDLLENIEAEIKVQDNRLTFSVEPKKIITIVLY